MRAALAGCMQPCWRAKSHVWRAEHARDAHMVAAATGGGRSRGDRSKKPGKIPEMQCNEGMAQQPPGDTRPPESGRVGFKKQKAINRRARSTT